MLRLRRLVPLAILMFASAAALRAQRLSFGEVGGTVTDAATRPLIEAEVRVRDRTSGAVRWVMTTRQGTYRFTVLPAGRYDVTVEALGYRPVVYADVALSAGQVIRLTTVLRPATVPLTTADTIRVASLAAQPGAWLLERGYGDLMGERRIASDLSFLSTTADDRGVEGLPWRLNGALVDGSRSTGIQSPVGLGADAALLAHPVRGASSVDVGGLGFDVEVGGTGVGVRMATQRGGGVGSSRSLVEGGTASIGGAFSAAGPLQGDTAQATFGVEYQRSQISRPAVLDRAVGDNAALISAATASYATTDLSAYSAPADRLTERLGGFGRLDWQPSERFAMTVRGSGSRLVSRGTREFDGALASYGSDYEAIGAQAALNVFGQLTRRIAHEFRVAVDVGDITSAADAFATTRFAGVGLGIGGPAGFDESRTTPRATGLLHFDLGAHRLKAGFAVATHLIDSRYAEGTAGEFRFGDVADFQAGDGAWRGVEGAVPAGEFKLSETSFFVQDAWRVADGLDVTLGARIDGTTLPVNEIEQNAQWLAFTGVDNRSVERKRSRISPRFGLRWELGRRREWLVEGGGGVFQDLPDSRDIAEALTLDRGADVRLGVGGVGALGTWPRRPDAAIAPLAGRTIAMLGPEFEGPRTRRLALSLTRRLGGWSSSFGGVYRHTDFLARRRDLNLSTTAVGADQNGRPLYGTLAQEGSVLAAEPGTNRRFAGFDAVRAIEATGFSDYWGVTVGIDRVRDRGLSLATSYTFSRTTDNVMGLGAPRLSPFPEGLGGVDWAEGTSDLDAPHRGMLAAEWSAGASGVLRLGALYRISSGAPFTPGVRDGVDANADGDASNDPAFVNAALPGMAALIDEWDCLRDANGFVERNACRGELAHRLDLRLSFRVANLSIGRLDVVIDALDVVATESGRIDHALLLVDRTSITTNPVSGVTTVPYVVNPGFGQVLADRSPGILWRAGLRIVP